ncbi:MAG: hypothetical protein ACHREM_24385 [Polyangiales bacterium]
MSEVASQTPNAEATRPSEPPVDSARSWKNREEELKTLRDAARHLTGKGLQDGSWLNRMIATHVKRHATRIDATYWDRRFPTLHTEARAKKLIDRVALKAAGAGFLASVGASSGEIVSLVSEGLAAPIGLPGTVLSMLLETAYTALLHVDLACDLASIYGVPFDPDDVGELATLFEVAKRGDDEPEEAETEVVTSIAEQIEHIEGGAIAGSVGKKLLEESVLKNVIPFVGIAISAPWNYYATQQLGNAVRKYVRYRRALEQSCKELHFPGDPTLLIEGAWLLITADGAAKHEELLAIALLVDAMPEGHHPALDKALNDDEDEWLERLHAVPEEHKGSLLEAFYLLASVDRKLQPSERRFLRRVGKALHREVDYARIENICHYLARGEHHASGA